MLYERLLEARRAFRYVFRNHPDVAERASSSYRRDRRATQRKRRGAGALGAPPED